MQYYRIMVVFEGDLFQIFEKHAFMKIKLQKIYRSTWIIVGKWKSTKMKPSKFNLLAVLQKFLLQNSNITHYRVTDIIKYIGACNIFAHLAAAWSVLCIQHLILIIK